MTTASVVGQQRPLRIAVVGAGPAGFYTVEALLKRAGPDLDIDLFERLPAPYGLLRYGVAPDHPKIKSVSAAYDRLCEDARVRFLGNVGVGLGDISVDELVERYDQVVFTTGCETDRRLGVPGEDLAGSLSATAFVGWYNGHPDYTTLPVSLDVGRAVVVGIGDVAMDLARVLLRDPEELATTDIADYALAALRKSHVREVVILARRGPRQAAFAAKELEDVAELPGVSVHIDGRLVGEELKAVDPHHGTERHKLEVLAKLAESTVVAERRLAIRFLVAPVEIVGTGGRVTALRIAHNTLEKNAAGDVIARATGRSETIPCGLVLRSVGYRGVPLAGLPFNAERGTVPNVEGRVLRDAKIWPGVYVAGWIKRGATGVVGTNKGDATATVVHMLEDLPTLAARDASAVARASIDALLRERGVQVVTWDGWKRIDQIERERGKAAGKSREKLHDVRELLAAAGV